MSTYTTVGAAYTAEVFTAEELADALKTVRFWGRVSDSEPIAYRMKVLHPDDAAQDILTGIRVRRQQCS
jgi:hypothetical protein